MSEFQPSPAAKASRRRSGLWWLAAGNAAATAAASTRSATTWFALGIRGAQEPRELPERPHHAQACRRFGAAQLDGDLLVRELPHHAQFEGLALLPRQGLERGLELASKLTRGEAVLDRLEVELVRAYRHPQPPPSGLVDPAALVVAAHQVLRDPVEPGRRRPASLVAKPLQAQRDRGISSASVAATHLGIHRRATGVSLNGGLRCQPRVA